MISIIIPFHNEEKNLPILLDEIRKELNEKTYEVVCINDGSTDNSLQILEAYSKSNPHVYIVSYYKRKGKGYALQQGIQKAKGSTIIFMDADLQDDPADIPHFLAKLESGYDVVNGWRTHRQDTSVMKFISKIGNNLLWQGLLHSPLHDVNCGFKTFKRTVVDMIPLYGDNFRFLPLLAHQEGYRVTEVAVHNRPRTSGASKYSPLKMLFGLFDTITTYFIVKFAEKPLHFFGVIGGLLFSIGFVVTLILTIQRIFFGILLYRRPALQFAILFVIVGIQIILTGIVAELMVYITKKSEQKKS